MSRSLDGSPYASERSARSLEPTGAFALVLILAKTVIDPEFFHSNKDHHLPISFYYTILLIHITRWLRASGEEQRSDRSKHKELSWKSERQSSSGQIIIYRLFSKRSSSPHPLCLSCQSCGSSSKDRNVQATYGSGGGGGGGGGGGAFNSGGGGALMPYR